MLDPEKKEEAYQDQQENVSIYQNNPEDLGELQTGKLVSKFLMLLACLFMLCAIGTYLGISVILNMGIYTLVAVVGLILFCILQFKIFPQKIFLLLLLLFMFLEGFALGPIFSVYLIYGNILGETFLIASITLAVSAIYSWITEKVFTHKKDFLFFIFALILIGGFIALLFQIKIIPLVVIILVIIIVCSCILYFVQRIIYIADTFSNAIHLVVAFFTFDIPKKIS
jgi:FtsH-binding integral membrane protein